MDRAQVHKRQSTGSLLEVRLMEDKALWSALMARLRALEQHTGDGRDVRAYNDADQALDIAIELQTRGTQLELFPEGI